jgi:aminopeptidase N
MLGSVLAVTLAVLALVDPPAAGRRQATPDAPDPGVSEALARDRAARISDLRYKLSFTVPPNRDEAITGRADVGFTLTGASAALAIDFNPSRARSLHAVSANGRPIDVLEINEHIVIPAGALHEGHNDLRFDFDAGDAPLNRNDDFLYTIFVPARAHEAFPCFDQPDLKARWTLSLDVPAGWETVANGAELSRESQNGRTALVFAETEPVSTYLFAFATGKFQIEQGERNGRTFRMFHRETDAGKVARNRDTIFDLHAAAIAWMEQYTGIPYPFGKFDFLLVPAFQFGGMEHPGAIFYNAAGVLLDESATENQKLERASVIAHETTHMWFGDLVTMKWFSDVWMKEVFANFMAAKIVNPSFPAINHDLRFLMAYYPAAYDVDRTAGSNPVRQPLANLNEAGTLYGAIIYQKAPIVMRQLETLVGADRFRDGLRDYLKRYSFGNASWPDLIELLGRRTSEDLAAWSHAWVDEAGRPAISTHLTIEHGGIARLTLTAHDPYPGRGLMWNQRLQVALGYDDGVRMIPAHVNGASVEVALARHLKAPRFVLANGGGIGYGEMHLDPASRQWLVRKLPSVADPLTRGSAWVTLWDAMLDAEVLPSDIIDLALRALPRETNEQNV